MDEGLTYHRLIAEHIEIHSALLGLLDSLEGMRTRSSSLLASLEHLGALVKAHVHNEEILLGNLSQSQMDCSGLQLWKAAANDFERLRSDWLKFLAEWNLDSIEHRRMEFSASTRSILERLQERVSFETKTLYAIALESGAIHER